MNETKLFKEVDDLIKYVDDLTNDFEDLKGFENLYKINRKGEIFSIQCNKILTHQLTGDDYYYVQLRKNRERRKCRIHRLLAIQFIPNPNNHPEVDHIDRDKSNNTIPNLRWVSRIENANNKSNNISNLSSEELKQRKDDLKTYKRLWAEKDRRNKGMISRSEMNKTKDPMYNANWLRNKRESMTEDEKKLLLEHRRLTRKPLTEEQKQKARERARKQRLNKQSDKQ